MQYSNNEPPKLYKGMTESSSYDATGFSHYFYPTILIRSMEKFHRVSANSGSLQMPKLAIIFASEFIIFAQESLESWLQRLPTKLTQCVLVVYL